MKTYPSRVALLWRTFATAWYKRSCLLIITPVPLVYQISDCNMAKSFRTRIWRWNIWTLMKTGSYICMVIWYSWLYLPQTCNVIKLLPHLFYKNWSTLNGKATWPCYLFCFRKWAVRSLLRKNSSFHGSRAHWDPDPSADCGTRRREQRNFTRLHRWLMINMIIVFQI